MGVLQNEFDRVLHNRFDKPNLIKAVLQRALKGRSVSLGDEQLDRVAAALGVAIANAKEGNTNVSVNIPREWIRPAHRTDG